MKIVMTAKSPIVHGEFSDGIDLGNLMNFRHIPMISNGELYRVPAISGNAIRGVLRRLLARELVDRYALKDAMGKSFDKFYIAIANGGNLDKSMDVDVDTNKLRQMRAGFPMLSVLGASLYKFIIPGMCNIGFAIPHCAELGTGNVRINDLTADVGLTRHIDCTVADPGEAKPMPYTVETVVAGAEFDVTITFAPQATDIERSCINHGLNLLHYVGGKHSVGFGEVDICGIEDDSLYTAWLEDDHTETLIKFAGEL